VRNAHPAEDDMVARGKGVHVVAVSDSHVVNSLKKHFNAKNAKAQRAQRAQSFYG
jgi:hypothetical protein